MAWNRPSANGPTIQKKSGLSPAVKGLLGGGIVVAALAVVLFLVFGGNDVPKVAKADKGHGMIKEVTPAAAPKVEVEEEKPKIDPNARPTKVGEKLNGYVKLASGRIHKILGETTNDMSQVKNDYEIFDHWAENTIACLLTIKPGEALIDTPNYRGLLTKDFIESLKHPIIINPDDSERDKELKRAVTQTKIELKAAMDRGEDIEKIILDARAECQRLNQYKQFLQDEWHLKMQDQDATPEELSDFVSAANKLLEEKGVAPLRLSPIMKRKLMIEVQKED